MSAALIMGGVAILCGILAVMIFRRATPTEAAVYRNRIAATMLAAGAIILVAYALALHRWDAAV